eukprot:479325_1
MPMSSYSERIIGTNLDTEDKTPNQLRGLVSESINDVLACNTDTFYHTPITITIGNAEGQQVEDAFNAGKHRWKPHTYSNHRKTIAKQLKTCFLGIPRAPRAFGPFLSVLHAKTSLF